MTDRQLECIVTIANNASITEAAKKLFVSQSSLSQSLSNVERELGVSLFTRSSGNLEMTYAGEEFVHAAREILEIKQNITNRLADLEHSPRGKITVGISQKRSWLFMPSVLAAFIKKYPEAKVVFIEAEQQLLDEIVLTGKADLAFTTQAPVKRELEYHHLYQEHILLALPKDHTLCSEFQRHGIADISRLKETPFILNHQGHDIRAISDRIFRDFHIDPLIILESHSMDVCFQLAAYGLGAAIIPDTLEKSHPSKEQVQCFRVGDAYSRPVSIIYRKNLYMSFLLKEFVRIATEQIVTKYVDK